MGCAPSAEGATNDNRNENNDNDNELSNEKETDNPPAPEPEPDPSEVELKDENKVSPEYNHDEDDVSDDVDIPQEDTKPAIIELHHVKVTMGRECHQVLDTRSETRAKVQPPQVSAGELWVDEDFTRDVAMDGKEHVDWKRPQEFVENPVLFSEGTTRFDIGQGRAGTCWFLSILAALGDREELIQQVIADDYKIGTDEYRGVFHCRFWKFGEWMDVYVDDHIPIHPGTNSPWGAHSATDPNEMWVSLMEKAFAKLNGSYTQADGGWCGDAFISLTGGMAERVEHKNVTSTALFTRVQNALGSGCIISSSVPPENDNKHGLAGGHAYTLTASTMVISNRKRKMLFRIRNPWGTFKGEWKGAWSDNSSEWNTVSETVRDQLNVEGRGDGEFWINIIDYFKYFRDTHICNFTPDFDLDGSQDNLDKSIIAFGEWQGTTAAGGEMPTKLDNPKFIFSVPTQGLDADGTIPIVIQFCQERHSRKDKQLAYLRADFFKIEAQFKKTKLCITLDEVTNNTTFFGGPSITYRYKCTPGKYLVAATTMEPNIEKDFMIRIFSSQALTIKKYEETSETFIRRFDMVEAFHTPYKLDHFYGEWSGRNSGGQIRYQTFAKNPQYVINITGSSSDVMLSLKQEISGDREALGIKLYKSDGVRGPLTLDYMYRHHADKTVNPTDGNGIFIIAYDASGLFKLPPGQYTAVLFLNQPDVEKNYVFTVGYERDSKLMMRGFNTLNDGICLAK